MQEEVKFEVKDRHGRTVRLRRSVYDRHVENRPEMADYLEEAQATIQAPDWELDDEGVTTYVRLGLGRGEFEKLFLRIPVYYAGDIGEVATFHFTPRIGRGAVKWKKET